MLLMCVSCAPDAFHRTNILKNLPQLFFCDSERQVRDCTQYMVRKTGTFFSGLLFCHDRLGFLPKQVHVAFFPSAIMSRPFRFEGTFLPH